KTAYASYWAEIINGWMEENERHEKLYRLFEYVLSQLDDGAISEALLSILFQMRFLKLAGLSPNLSDCSICRSGMESAFGGALLFDLPKGGIVCERCARYVAKSIRLSKGTIKQLCWLESDDINKASRIRFSPAALNESLSFLEAFVPFHLGKKPRSLAFLQQVRR
ncbi:DNA repair protein RecO, partial [Thermodesulfobacteriota bacterium]